jgi:L-ascorbate metabolism protein UlaG (beta-lactamase superfamily)
MGKAKITWLGHSSLQVEFGGHVIFLDPWIEENPTCSLALDDIQQASAVCVTHGHIDHLGDSLKIVGQTGAMLVCSPEIGFYADRKGITYDEGSYPLNIGGSWTTESFKITMVSADHTSDIMGDEYTEDGTIMPGSGCVGYVLDFAHGPSVYYSGDTGVFGDMAIIRDLYRPEVAIFTVGGKYNMGVREAAYAASLVLPEYLIATHHGTFPDQMLDFDEFASELKTRAPKVRLLRLEPGESFQYP